MCPRIVLLLAALLLAASRPRVPRPPSRSAPSNVSVVGITNKRADRANEPLARVLQALVEERVLTDYKPSPLPVALFFIANGLR